MHCDKHQFMFYSSKKTQLNFIRQFTTKMIKTSNNKNNEGRPILGAKRAQS